MAALSLSRQLLLPPTAGFPPVLSHRVPPQHCHISTVPSLRKPGFSHRPRTQSGRSLAPAAPYPPAGPQGRVHQGWWAAAWSGRHMPCRQHQVEGRTQTGQPRAYETAASTQQRPRHSGQHTYWTYRCARSQAGMLHRGVIHRNPSGTQTKHRTENVEMQCQLTCTCEPSWVQRHR